MARLQYAFAIAILIVWAFVVYKATRRPELTTLATVITPVMLAPAGWLYTRGVKAELRRRSDTSRRGDE